MICVDNLAVRAGSFHLADISISIPTGAYAVLMGRTGSGKTTLLESICGLKKVSQGRISLMGRDVTALKPALRGVGYVPQDGALFPYMSVRDHLGFAPAVGGWPAPEIDRRVSELSALLGLERLLHRRPAGLSGGEAQRVALGRALAAYPNVLCLDEPLSALDEETRAEMCAVLLRLRDHTGVTVLHVTHNSDETRRLADVVFTLSNGRVAQSQA